jgi:hypothetical protein
MALPIIENDYAWTRILGCGWRTRQCGLLIAVRSGAYTMAPGRGVGYDETRMEGGATVAFGVLVRGTNHHLCGTLRCKTGDNCAGRLSGVYFWLGGN